MAGLSERRPRKVLVVAAHPDDEVLGCGGTIARHADRGDQVSILILGEGLTSRAPSRDVANRDELPDLQRDARTAASLLGVHDVTLLDFPDNRFDTVPLLDVIKSVERERDRMQPDLIYVHHWGDLNVDHGVTIDAVLAAFRPLPALPAVDIYAYEVPSSTTWGLPSAASAFIPTHFVDVTNAIDRKVAAMDAYQSERRAAPHPRAAESLRAWAQYRGTLVGIPYAEAFATVRTFGI